MPKPFKLKGFDYFAIAIVKINFSIKKYMFVFSFDINN